MTEKGVDILAEEVNRLEKVIREKDKKIDRLMEIFGELFKMPCTAEDYEGLVVKLDDKGIWHVINFACEKCKNV